MIKIHEANFDGLVGNTHNYAGLSLGNIASTKNKNLTSNPKAAALQGLNKMKALADAGYIQGVLAPQMRPNINALRNLGFDGSDAAVIKQAVRYNKQLVFTCYSASSMWAANAATVSPSADTKTKTVHFTPANLVNNFHRSMETKTTALLLKKIFADDAFFTHNSPLPNNMCFGDEGAANHTRLCDDYTGAGTEVFVFGRYAFDNQKLSPNKYPARQTFEASQAIARKHQLNLDKVIFLQQNPQAIDQGVFHNDVISVGNQQLFFCHEAAFVNQQYSLTKLQETFDGNLNIVQVINDEVTIKDAVDSYLFNSQLLALGNGKHQIIVPKECQTVTKVWNYLQDLLSKQDIIVDLKVMDLNQSMNNGGGPACLRLRVVLNDNELKACNQNCILTDELYVKLVTWINKHYRDKLSEEDLLFDSSLITKTYDALDELTQILKLGSLYEFQH